MRTSNSKRIRVFLMLMATCCGVVWSFTNLSYDGEYQISMSYRLLQGDKMIREMWEPHQTSAFLSAALMWVYMSIFHTTTGIVVFLQMCGILIRGGLAFLLYRVLREDIDEPVAFGIGMLYFMLSPKDYALPEFSNQQVWYSTLLFCCLWAYLKKGKKFLLVLSAVWLCMEVLAYPSCLVVFFGVIGILICYSKCRLRDIFIFTGICACAGIGVCGFLFLPELDTTMQCIKGMLALEPTHTRSVLSKLLVYLKEGVEQLTIIMILAAAGFVISRLILLVLGKDREAGNQDRHPTEKGCLKETGVQDRHPVEKRCLEETGVQDKHITEEMRMNRKQLGYGLWLLCCGVLILAGFTVNILSADKRNAYSVIFLFLIGIGLWHGQQLNGKEKQAYFCGSIIGGLEFLATLILTDLSVRDCVVYGVLAIVFALIPIGKYVESLFCMSIKKGLYICGICFLLLLGLRCAYIRTPLVGRGQICSSLSDLSIVRSGPALGLITDEEGSCRQRDSYLEWKEWIRPGDKVWIVGCVLDTLGYLYENVEVAAPSTMSAPYYCSTITEYWQLNPDKYPDVIVAEGYMGELVNELLENDWLMTWIQEEYQPESVVEGKYWVYFFRKAR